MRSPVCKGGTLSTEFLGILSLEEFAQNFLCVLDILKACPQTDHILNFLITLHNKRNINLFPSHLSTLMDNYA